MEIVDINGVSYYKIPHVNLDGTRCFLYFRRPILRYSLVEKNKLF